VAPAARPAAEPVDAVPPAVRDRSAAAGPDGVRWDLVERVRAEIAAGTYDVEARWAAAEERLLRAAERAG
jgi:anti-sigma28 factor (negative regulator of flagellin synthesis)